MFSNVFLNNKNQVLSSNYESADSFVRLTGNETENIIMEGNWTIRRKDLLDFFICI